MDVCARVGIGQMGPKVEIASGGIMTVNSVKSDKVNLKWGEIRGKFKVLNLDTLLLSANV